MKPGQFYEDMCTVYPFETGEQVDEDVAPEHLGKAVDLIFRALVHSDPNCRDYEALLGMLVNRDPLGIADDGYPVDDRR